MAIEVDSPGNRRPMGPLPRREGQGRYRPPLSQPAPSADTHRLHQQPPVATAPVAQPVKPSPATPASTVSIHLQLPSLPIGRLWKQLQRTVRKVPSLLTAHRRISLAVGVLLIATGLTFSIMKVADHARQAAQADKAAANQAQQAVAAKPTFKPVAPAERPQLGILGPKSAFDGAHQVYSYIDSLDKQQITVSEQQVPSQFKSANDAVSNIAKSFGPSTSLAVAGGTAYVATNSKYSSQTVVAPVKDLIIFIQASQLHDNASWQNYLNDLK